MHRVQRVPDTEASGRIHTSAATVAVLPEVEDVDIHINESDLKIDTMRAQGAGGQHVNKTESAIRITHVPSGIVVFVQEERSQHKNKSKAMTMLRAKLYDVEKTKRDSARAAERRGQVGSGDRSERIRTYNFPQGRVTDHRINLTLHKLPQDHRGRGTRARSSMRWSPSIRPSCWPPKARRENHSGSERRRFHLRKRCSLLRSRFALPESRMPRLMRACSRVTRCISIAPA